MEREKSILYIETITRMIISNNNSSFRKLNSYHVETGEDMSVFNVYTY